MDHRNQSTSRPAANIARQQPINPVESNLIPPSSLEQRIQNIQRTASQLLKPTHSLFSTSQKTQSQKLITSLRKPATSQRIQHPNLEESTSSQTTAKNISIPIVQIPRKSTLPFIERFMAHHANHQNPKYRKIASLPCDQNEDRSISLYIFKDEKRAYKAAGEYGTNQYKFGGGRLVSYYPTVEKVPNKAKFNNEFQKQVYRHLQSVYIIRKIR